MLFDGLFKDEGVVIHRRHKPRKIRIFSIPDKDGKRLRRVYRHTRINAVCGERHLDGKGGSVCSEADPATRASFAKPLVDKHLVKLVGQALSLFRFIKIRYSENLDWRAFKVIYHGYTSMFLYIFYPQTAYLSRDIDEFRIAWYNSIIQG